MAIVSGGRSTLNPDAPLFVPAALQQVEDFSPQWWDLVKTSTWFRDYWFHQHQEQDNFEGTDEDDDDIANLLPDSIDLGITEEFLNLESQFEDTIEFVRQGEMAPVPLKKEQWLAELGMNVDALSKNPSLKSPRGGEGRSPAEAAKYWEKPLKRVSPKCSPRRIQQPR